MVATTTLDVAKYQDPNKPGELSWEEWIKRGVTSVIVQLSHGTSYEPKAKEFIAAARSHGLKVHGYHFYEGSLDEILFSYQNAEKLGLNKGAYMFLDMEGNIGGNWQDQFYSFRSAWLQAGFRAGLYVSESPYTKRFDNNKLVNDGVYRWIADYSREPKNYDVWQYSDSNGKQDVSYDRTGKLGQDYVPHQVPSLVPPNNSDSNFEPGPRNPNKPTGNSWVGWGTDSSGLGGGKTLGYSTDGKNFYAVLSPWGIAFRQNDFDRIWDDMKKRIPKISNEIAWANILDKPDVALKSDLPNLSGYAKLTDIPSVSDLVNKSDLSVYAKKSDIPALPDMSKFALKSEIPDTADLSKYALKSEIPSLDNYAKLSDIPSITGLVKEAELDNYAKKADLPDFSKFATKADLSSSSSVKQTDLDKVKATAESALSNANKAQSTADANTKKFDDYVSKDYYTEEISSIQQNLSSQISDATNMAYQAQTAADKNTQALASKVDQSALKDYATKDDLKSIKPSVDVPQINSGDFNNLTENKTYEISSNSGYTHAPVNGKKGILVVHGGQQCLVQVFYAVNDYVYHRMRYAGSWHEWKWSNDWN